LEFIFTFYESNNADPQIMLMASVTHSGENGVNRLFQLPKVISSLRAPICGATFKQVGDALASYSR